MSAGDVAFHSGCTMYALAASLQESRWTVDRMSLMTSVRYWHDLSADTMLALIT